LIFFFFKSGTWVENILDEFEGSFVCIDMVFGSKFGDWFWNSSCFFIFNSVSHFCCFFSFCFYFFSSFIKSMSLLISFIKTLIIVKIINKFTPSYEFFMINNLIIILIRSNLHSFILLNFSQKLVKIQLLSLMRNFHSICINELHHSFIRSQSHYIVRSSYDPVIVLIKIFINFWHYLNLRLQKQVFTFLWKKLFFDYRIKSLIFWGRLFEDFTFVFFEFFLNVVKYLLGSRFCEDFEAGRLFLGKIFEQIFSFFIF